MVGVNGLEPLISRLSAECSNQLSYTPNICIVTVYARTYRFLHPLRGRAWSVSFALAMARYHWVPMLMRRSHSLKPLRKISPLWGRRVDSNHRPSPYEGDELPLLYSAWLSRKDSNLRLTDSKSVGLPLAHWIISITA